MSTEYDGAQMAALSAKISQIAHDLRVVHGCDPDLIDAWFLDLFAVAHEVATPTSRDPADELFAEVDSVVDAIPDDYVEQRLRQVLASAGYGYPDDERPL